MYEINVPGVQPGDLLELVGMQCLDAGTIRMVNKTNTGQLYIFCGCGKHPVYDRPEDPDVSEFQVVTLVPRR